MPAQFMADGMAAGKYMAWCMRYSLHCATDEQELNGFGPADEPGASANRWTMKLLFALTAYVIVRPMLPRLGSGDGPNAGKVLDRRKLAARSGVALLLASVAAYAIYGTGANLVVQLKEGLCARYHSDNDCIPFDSGAVPSGDSDLALANWLLVGVVALAGVSLACRLVSNVYKRPEGGLPTTRADVAVGDMHTMVPGEAGYRRM
jgi:hypothetical protein